MTPALVAGGQGWLVIYWRGALRSLPTLVGVDGADSRPATAVLAAEARTMAQASWKPIRGVAPAAASRATSVATPSAAPTWREAASTAVPRDRSSRGAASAPAKKVGWMNALAMPHSSRLGRIHVT